MPAVSLVVIMFIWDYQFKLFLAVYVLLLGFTLWRIAFKNSRKQNKFVTVIQLVIVLFLPVLGMMIHWGEFIFSRLFSKKLSNS